MSNQDKNDATVQKSNLIIPRADVSEIDLRERYPEVLETLLRDHSTKKNIIWATDNYAALGSEFSFHAHILPSLVTGAYGKVIRPRVCKDKDLQVARIRDMAEVFTPSWICNAQNNLIDADWFGRENVFNIEHGETWEPITDKITFPKGRTWKDYVRANRMEITCGEAPYITSRYDTTTGEFIPVERRIGLLDRKLRVVSENVETSGLWLRAAQDAYKSVYAYEWQGDSLLLAREAMLWTFIENYMLKFRRIPQKKSIKFIAYIISWNVWQMDGLKFVVPESCHDEQEEELNLGVQIAAKPCPGCATEGKEKHNGTHCLIKDWNVRDPKTKKRGMEMEYASLTRGGRT